MSANSIPSLFVRATSLPVKTCVSARRDASGAGRPRADTCAARAASRRSPPRRATRADRVRAGTSGRSGGRPSGRRAASARARAAHRRAGGARRGFDPAASSTPSGRRAYSSSRSIGARASSDDARAGTSSPSSARCVSSVTSTRQPRRRRQREAGAEREQERRRQRDELRPGEHERRQQADRRDARVRRELRRRVARHRVGWTRSSAAGVGTVSSRSRTTSSAETRCTHSSGRSVRRCASAGTATDLTSSGVT